MFSKSRSKALLTIDAEIYLSTLRRFIGHLRTNEALINDLNVFPVPDGDTGTNSLLTVQGCLDLDSTTRSVQELAQLVADVCGDQARGNSGVILSEYLRGIADDLSTNVDTSGWQRAISNAAQVARASVSSPRDGTILTVADVLAEVEVENDFPAYAKALARAARNAVQLTTEQLPELQAAGVVDAGALVLSLFHDSLYEQVSGVTMPELDVATRTCDLDSFSYDGPANEVMFLFDGTSEALAELKNILNQFGDSVTVSGSIAPYNIHVHIDEPAQAVDAAMRLGSPYRIVVTPLVASETNHQGQDAGQTTRAVVICHGSQMVKIIEQAGAMAVQAMPRGEPATWEIRAAAQKANAQNVVILPSDSDCFGSANKAVRDLLKLGISAQVVPTASIIQSLAALAVLDENDDLETAVKHMTRVVKDVQFGAVTIAQRSVPTPVGTCVRGDVLGLVAGQVVAVSAELSPEQMALAVMAKLGGDGADIITIVASEDFDEKLLNQARKQFPGADVIQVVGGQSLWPYLIGVE